MDRGEERGRKGGGRERERGKEHLNIHRILKAQESSTPAARAEPHAVYTAKSCSRAQCSAAQYIIPKPPIITIIHRAAITSHRSACISPIYHRHPVPPPLSHPYPTP